MGDDSQLTGVDAPRKLLPRSIAGEAALAVALLGISAAFTYHAIIEAHRGKSIFAVVDTLGFASLFFGFCFDPVNFAALLLPWVWDNVAAQERSNLRWSGHARGFAQRGEEIDDCR